MTQFCQNMLIVAWETLWKVFIKVVAKIISKTCHYEYFEI